MNVKNRKQILANACAPAPSQTTTPFEQLERRQMFASTVQALPFNLNFDAPVSGTLLDRDGRGVGLTQVQANKNGDAYQPSLINLDTAAGVLRLTTRGSAANGSSGGLDNSLTNGLETGFDANQRGFAINTRLVGPLSNLNDRFEQAGIYFGPDQDNYVKLVAGRNWNGQYLSFEDEFTNATGGVSSTRNGTNAQTAIGNFASITTLDLRLVGDASTGAISAYYRVNSDTGGFTKVGYDVAISPEKRSAFFNAAGKAGLIAQHKNDVGPITATFDSFSITAGTPVLARPSVAGLEGMDGTTLGFRRDATITALLTLPNGGAVDASTLNATTVKLYRTGDDAPVAATRGAAAAGSRITIDPGVLLDPNTTYTVEITGGLKDSSGQAFQPFLMSFTTGTAFGNGDNDVAGPTANYAVDKLFFSDIHTGVAGGSGTSAAQKIRISNTGVADLVLGANALQFSGSHGGEFQLGGGASLPLTIEPGEHADVPIVFNAGAIGLRTATLTITTNDASAPTQSIALRGLGTAGNGGNLEPSLQRILDLYQIPVNVGDPTPDTTDIPSPATGGDAVDIERLRRAGTGPVTIEVLANFANSVSPSSRFGYYSAGQLADRTQLFTVGNASSQTVRPTVDGTLSFDPAGDFGIYAEFPAFANRVVASEKVYNAWEADASRQQKVRFFPMRNADGSTVPNAYVFTFEEWNVAFDQNDVVGIIRNVVAAPAGPEIALVNADGVPFTNRLVMSRIRDTQVWNEQGYIPNTVHDRATLRVTNTGSQPLNVSGVSISNGDFIVESGGGAFTLNTGQSRDVVVQFVFNRDGLGNEVRTATLTLNSNDADESTKTVQLGGLWQSYSENAPNGVTQEPTAQTVLQAFGYNVNLGTQNTRGAISRAGEEILSEYWQTADASRPVGARQLAAFHQQRSTTNSRIRQLPLGATGVGTTIFAHVPSDGQTLLPRNNAGGGPGYGEFTPAGTFSWTVDSNQSIDARNANAIDGGHSLRFYAAKDQAGNVIPNTYILLMDYVGQSFSNYDYQDNIYLLTNVKPVSGALAPAGANAYPGSAGVALVWQTNPEGNLAGYNIYRSTGGGAAVRVNASLITGSGYTDAGALVGVNYQYQIRPVDVHGTEGAAATVTATRTSDGVAPAAPAFPTANGTTGGIQLNWLDNAEADLAGYNVYRATTANGTYVKLNGSPLTGSSYLDLAAPAAATSYYRVTSVDVSGNQSVAAPLSAYRPASGSVPNAPTNLAAPSTTTSSVTLTWADNAGNETGFVIERRNPDGTWAQVGTTGANVTTFTHAALPGGTAFTYRVRATNAAGASAFSNEVTATTQQGVPAAPTNLNAAALAATAVRLTWTDNSETETGYRVERRLGTTGTWATLETVGTNITLYVDHSAVANTTYNYRVTAINAVGASPASNTAVVTTPAADGYASVDIGSPAIAGSTVVVNAGRDYDVVAGGADVWATADQFRYVYRGITGDFDYSARITDVSQADIGSMAGLMARESLAANARHIFMRARAEGMRANYRPTTGGESVGIGRVAFTYPNAYVRLQRVGSVFTAYASTDGQTWTVVTQQTMAMGSQIFLGIAASARSTTGTTTAKVRDLTDRNAVAVPAAPTNLTGTADATPRVTFAWADNATNETGYRVERRASGSTAWVTVATLAPNATGHVDATVSPGQQYVYRVFATSAAGDSAASNELTATVSTGLPAAPSNLNGGNVAGGIRLAWIDNASNETHVQIERRLANGSGWSPLAIVSANVTTYTDAALTAGTAYVYRVRALGTAGDSAYSDEFTIAAPATLAFTSSDVGGAAGGATQVVGDGTSYNVTAAGTDVWNAADQFRFVHRQVTGNFDVRVRVAALGFTSDQSMAGLMARATLDANSRNVFVKARADGSQRVTYRSNTGGATTGVGAGTATFPNGWLRLTRVGNTFTGYGSADGVSWTVVSSVTLSLPTTMYVGMAVASHVTGATTTAQFRDLTLA